MKNRLSFWISTRRNQMRKCPISRSRYRWSWIKLLRTLARSTSWMMSGCHCKKNSLRGLIVSHYLRLNTKTLWKINFQFSKLMNTLERSTIDSRNSKRKTIKSIISRSPSRIGLRSTCHSGCSTRSQKRLVKLYHWISSKNSTISIRWWRGHSAERSWRIWAMLL